MITKTGPTINRYKSEQDVQTPRSFLDAVESRFGKIGFDLAANASNKVVDDNAFFDPKYLSALDVDWQNLFAKTYAMVCWLNPPYGDIGPWVKKCAEDMKHRQGLTLVLIPVAPDTIYYRKYIEGQCLEIPLSPRLKFVGHKSGFPKPLMLLVYGFGLSGKQNTWVWL